MSRESAAKHFGMTLDDYDTWLLNSAHQAGVERERERITAIFKESDSACADWAIGLLSKPVE